MAVPKKLKTADLEAIFGAEGVAALATKIRENRHKPKIPELVVRVLPADYGIALAALEGRVNREAGVSLRRTALRFAILRKDEFAGWLEEQTVLNEHGDEPEPTPLEALDGEDDSLLPDSLPDLADDDE